MTDSRPDDPRQDPAAEPDALERFRDDFGRSLLSAAREHEREHARPARPARGPRRRRAAVAAVAACAAAVLVVTGLPSPGEDDSPLLGASPAEAAVQELRRSLREGVLVRRAETTQYGRTVQRRTEEDWTDLATREQHARFTGGDPEDDVEYWNPAADERWSRGTQRAADGRILVRHAVDRDQENISSTQSPAEEVDDLLARARSNDLVVLRRTVEQGERVVVLEQRERCYASPDGSSAMCPETPDRWPAGAPDGMRPVTLFQTWWLQEGAKPQILRHENGNVPRGSRERDVQYRVRYTRWDVLPATEQHLSLVRPPAFPADRFLVVEE